MENGEYQKEVEILNDDMNKMKMSFKINWLKKKKI